MNTGMRRVGWCLLGIMGLTALAAADDQTMQALWRRLWPDVALTPTDPLGPPVVTQPAANRVPFDDPTAEFSRQAALPPPPVPVPSPLPFSRPELPDPLEHQRAVRLTNPPAEIPLPATDRLPPP
ncbi:MAG: hypothetical protein NZ700_10850 [Gemmataceae bacterium]|nr:hypothetical protein [Gemmataceae bacterium]MDW8264694.1 hypothetical protein [Gemmataceae bacterium]